LLEDLAGAEADALEVPLERRPARRVESLQQRVAALEVGLGQRRPLVPFLQEIGQRGPDLVAIGRLGEQLGAAEVGRDDRARIAGQEAVRHVAPLELGAQREAGGAIEVDVDDRPVNRLLLQQLQAAIDPSDRAGDAVAAVAHHLADLAGGQEIVFHDQDFGPVTGSVFGDACHGSTPSVRRFFPVFNQRHPYGFGYLCRMPGERFGTESYNILTGIIASSLRALPRSGSLPYLAASLAGSPERRRLRDARDTDRGTGGRPASGRSTSRAKPHR